jgi:hypothetical protein
VSEASLVEVEIAIGKLKRYKFQGTDQISAKLIQAGGETFCSEIHKLIHSVWNKEEFPQQWKESVIVPIHKKVDKTGCNNYGGIFLLSTAHKILSNIFLTRLTPYVSEIIGDHQCVFHHNRSTTNQIFYIQQILEKKWEYNGTVHQLFVGCETRLLTLREEHRLRVFENRVLRRIFGPKREEGRSWRKLHNEELYSLYSSHSIVRVIKSRRMRFAGHVAHMREGRSVYMVLIGIPEGKRPLGRPRHGWMDNIKWTLGRQGLRGSAGFSWLRIESSGNFFVNMIMNLWII